MLERTNMLNNIIKILAILVLLQWLVIHIDEMIFAYYDAKYELEIQGLHTDMYDNIDNKEKLEN